MDVLKQKIVETIPQRAFVDVGAAFGWRELQLPPSGYPDIDATLVDCCLFDWLDEGRNVVRRYADEHLSDVSSEDRIVVDAYLRAQYRILMPASGANPAPTAVYERGTICTDVLSGGEILVVDRDVTGVWERMPRNSRHWTLVSEIGIPALATRTIPSGDAWRTTGAAFAIPKKLAASLVTTLRSSDPLQIVRACLKAGAGSAAP